MCYLGVALYTFVHFLIISPHMPPSRRANFWFFPASMSALHLSINSLVRAFASYQVPYRTMRGGAFSGGVKANHLGLV